MLPLKTLKFCIDNRENKFECLKNTNKLVYNMLQNPNIIKYIDECIRETSFETIGITGVKH